MDIYIHMNTYMYIYMCIYEYLYLSLSLCFVSELRGADFFSPRSAAWSAWMGREHPLDALHAAQKEQGAQTGHSIV